MTNSTSHLPSGEAIRQAGDDPRQGTKTADKSENAGVGQAQLTPEAGPNATTIEDLRGRGRARLADRIFSGSAKGASAFILAILAAVAAFLVAQAWPALSDPNLKLRVIGKSEGVSLFWFTAPQLFGTLLAALVAMVIAVPIALGVAIFITHYAPARFATQLGYLVDLLAAVPSVVYGLWGGLWLLPMLHPVMDKMSHYLGFIPFFAGPVSPVGRVLFSASVVLSIMIVPIITAVAREVFARTPVLQKEAALALGATRWEMIRMVVLPFGRSGAISAAMLGLGRALGETLAVAMVLSPGATFSLAIFQASKHSTIASNIALQYPEANQITASALVVTGLVLFVITMFVNMGARAVVARRKDFSGADA